MSKQIKAVAGPGKHLFGDRDESRNRSTKWLVSCPRNHQERTVVSRTGGGGRFLLGEGQNLRKRADHERRLFSPSKLAKSAAPREGDGPALPTAPGVPVFIVFSYVIPS